MKTQWKDIPKVPNSTELIDIVLSATHRKLPTQIRSGFKISRIRAFYTRKVKFAQEMISEKLGGIIEGFPRLNDVHPFHRDLFNCLYDADHLKIALGQLSTAKSLTEGISRDYVRLLKYSQSLFQAKQLKVAGLGRMATLLKRLKDTLNYLESVRQHIGRLPAIDPNTRTLVLAGFPNTGKSSFLRATSRADVEVQPYAFTTRSLFVGHADYKYLRFQIVDTPGVLDHGLEEMNTIEMQSVTALAHLRSCILYFIDCSEQCGYTLEAQINLYNSIKPLFVGKVVYIVANKTDVMKPEDLDPERQELLQSILKSGEVELLQMSCNTQDGVQEVKNTACERLIAERVSQKLKAGTTNTGEITGRLADIMQRIHVAQPMGGRTLETFIPEGIKDRKKYDKEDPERIRLARDIEAEQGGAGVYNVDMRADYILANPEWKHDRVPEIFNGMNVADYVDPDIEAKLAALEEEEEKLEAEGFYDSDEEIDDEEEATVLAQAEIIREKQALIRNEARMKKRLKNQAIIPRQKTRIPLSKMDDALDQLGVDTRNIVSRAREQSRPRGRSLARATTAEADGMDIDNEETPRERLRSKSRPRSRTPATSRRDDGVTDVTTRDKADRMAKLGQKKRNRYARQGEGDRHTTASLEKHLFSGKRGIGKVHSR